MLVRRYGYTGSYSAVHRFFKQLPSAAAPEAPLRLRFKPGEAAQVDFGAGPAITDARTGETFKTWVFVMTLCWSRHQYAKVVRNQNIATWLVCHRHAFEEAFSGVVGRLIIDNRSRGQPSATARSRSAYWRWVFSLFSTTWRNGDCRT